jgi:hypothetical protein
VRVTWLALMIVLVLEGFPNDAFAQSPLVCHAIRRGESATQAAQRVTGDGRNAYQAWFQIMNPSSRFVPKSQYNRIRAGWRACIVSPATRSTSSNGNREKPAVLDVPAATTGPGDSEAAAPTAAGAPTVLADAASNSGAHVGWQVAASDVFRRFRSIDFTMLWLCAAIVVPWFGWRMVDDYLARRETVAIVVRSFVDRFVDEFERPLVRYDSGEPPVKSHVRYGARRGRFDILLAPGEGRRYPNLSDHKKNVEYDVARVMYVLADDSFVTGALYANAGWIVVPFRFTAGSRQAGVACISSL